MGAQVASAGGLWSKQKMATGTTTALAPRWREAGALLALLPDAGPSSASAGNLLGVDNDVEAVRSFLAEYSQTPQTLRTYTREVERLLLWLVLVRRVGLKGLTRRDLAAYSAFLADPAPRERWCGPKRGRLAPRFSEHWRPFVGPLTEAGQRSALVIINVLLKYLVAAQYLEANPLALMRKQSQRTSLALPAHALVSERVLSGLQWEAVCRAMMPLDWPPPLRELEPDALQAGRLLARERFLVACCYFLALRIGELTTHTMGHFRQMRGLWHFFVVGKGQKAADIPANDALIDELRHVRAWLGLSPLPAPDDPTPLVPHLGPMPTPLGARRVHQLLAGLFGRAADAIATEHPREAEHLRRASPHWLRHTSLTRQVQAGLSLAEVKANARHSRLDTTLLYLHTEHDARHQAMQSHSWLEASPANPAKGS